MIERHSEGGLRAHSITVGYGKDSPILEGLSLDVLQGELTVIVGPNACGKSTLLRALARVLSVRCGVVELDGQVLNDLNQKALARRLGLLAQSSVAPGDMLVEDLVARGRYPHQSLAHQWNTEDDEAVARAMRDAGVSAFCSRRVGELSGGQRQRVWIAMALAQSTDILLLDEPTNYLDVDHIKWLQNYLQNYENAFILISHDVEFLNSVVNVIYHIEQAQLTRYTGDYYQFLAAYEVKKQQALRAYERQQQEVADMKDFIQRNKARVATRGMANSRAKRLEKMEILEKPQEKIKPSFGFKEGRTPSRFIIDAKDLVLGYDEPLTRPVEVVIERGKKIAVQGVNGLGKTTLLKTLLGMIPALSGSIEKGEFLQVGYFAQEDSRDNSKTALDYIWDAYPSLTNSEVRAALARCGLTNEHITSQMRVLSGGENAKVRLCKLMQESYNVLVLDEPTNHLDVDAKAELARALQAFKGTIVLVCHEPEFYESWVTDIWTIEDWTTKII